MIDGQNGDLLSAASLVVIRAWFGAEDLELEEAEVRRMNKCKRGCCNVRSALVLWVWRASLLADQSVLALALLSSRTVGSNPTLSARNHVFSIR